MSREDVVVVALRIIAVLLGLRAIDDIPGIVYLFLGTSDQPLGYWDIASLLLVAAYALVPVLLWILAPALARLMLPRVKPDAGEMTLSPSLESVGFLVLGTYLLTMAITELVHNWMFLAQSRRMLGGTWEVGPGEIARLVSGAVKLVLAFWVVLGARGLRRLIRSVRPEPPG